MLAIIEQIQTALGGNTGLALGYILLAVLSSQLVLMAYSSVTRLVHERDQQRLDRERLEALVLAAKYRFKEAQEVIQGWNGYRKFTVTQKSTECEDVNSFYLVPHDRKPLPPYKPGQYLTFSLDIPGRDKPVVRCYSLSDSPMRSDFYRVTIKREKAPPDKPGVPHGVASGFFTDHIKEGDILNVKAPTGHFYLDMTKNTPICLLGGGVGLTPMLSMAKAVAESGSRREVWLFFGCRSGGEHMLREDLNKLRNFENIRVVICYSRPGGSESKGGDYDREGRVTIEVLKEMLPSNNYEFFMCGNGAFMKTLNDGLEAWGVPEKDIHYEAFGPATVKKKAAPLAAAGAVAGPACKVIFAKSGKELEWNSAATNLLDFALEQGLRIESGCRAGSCGVCSVAIKSGTVDYVKQPDAAPEGGSCLTCICRPKGDLVLDA
ncbi:MAG: 2Fe-2S iron-sulfur cluster binding domain-containing protein [Verrucomicrobia bacterium]|nr:2Fe-2S iron-sulfur cluster binding domain-containing protein [Verrucomicrobiota bacterium]